MNRLLNKNNGGALMITLLVMVMLTVAALMALNTANTDMDLSYNQMHSDQAFYLAEAGVKRAYLDLNNDDDWRTGYSQVAFDNGTYSVAVIDSIARPGLFDTVIIQATGIRDKACSNIEAWVVPEYRLPFQYALFGDQDINLGQSTCTDSYNSDSGTYAATLLLDGGDVASNGNIDLKNNAIIGGDVVTSDSGSITYAPTVNIYGDTSTTAEPHELEPITTEELEWAASVSDWSGISSDMFNSTDTSLELGEQDTLVLTSGIYYFSSITLGESSQLLIEPDGEVMIYLTGDLILNEASQINPTEPPPALVIMSTGGIYTIGQDTEMWLSFYGPDAEVELENSCEVYGSIVANTIDMTNIACLHYDRALADTRGGTTGVMTMIAWREL